MIFDDEKTVRDEEVRQPLRRGRTGALKQIPRVTLLAQTRKPRVRSEHLRILDLAPRLRRALAGANPVPQEPLSDDETTRITFED